MSHRNIARHKARGERWRVVFRKRDSAGKSVVVFSKVFSDSKHGGKRKALQAAIKVRDDWVKKFGNQGNHQPDRGVYFINRDQAYVANWHEKGKKKYKWFGISKYGHQAFDLAWQYRRKMTGT